MKTTLELNDNSYSRVAEKDMSALGSTVGKSEGTASYECLPENKDFFGLFAYQQTT